MLIDFRPARILTAWARYGTGFALAVSFALHAAPVQAAPFAYVTNLNSASVSVIDITTTPNTVVDTIPVGDGPRGVALTPDGTRAYVVNEHSDNVSVVDITTTPSTVVDTVAVRDFPFAVALTPDGTRAYVTNNNSASVSVIDTTTTPNTVVDTVTVGNAPESVALTPDGRRAYVTNRDSNSVSVIDTTTTPNTVVDTVAVGDGPIGVAITPHVSFSAFRVQLALTTSHQAFELVSGFTVGATSNGIAPLTEPVNLTIGDYTLTLPAGSFRRTRSGAYLFVGKIGQVRLEASLVPKADNRFVFQAVGYGADLGGITNPAPVTFTVGNDTGNTSVNAVLQ